MPMVSGFLRIVQPGLSPDNSLPGMEGPVDPGYGLGLGGGIDNGLPQPPPGVFPPPSPAHPIVPAPPDTPPGQIWPPVGKPPSWGGGRPAQPPPRPDQSPPSSQPRPDQGLPGQGGRPDQGLPGAGSSGTFWVVAGIPGVGWRYVCVDPSLRPDNSPPGQQPGIDNSLPGGRPNRPDNTLPSPPARPGNELPETPQPKRG